MTVEEIEAEWNKLVMYPISNPLHDFPKAQFANKHLAKLLAVAKAAKALNDFKGPFIGNEEEYHSLCMDNQEALYELEK